MHVRYLFILMVSVSFSVTLPAQSVTLSKYERTVRPSHDSKTMLLAGLTFIFNNAIVVNQFPRQHEATREHIQFLVPSATTVVSPKEMVKSTHPFYELTMQVVTTPKQGVQFDVWYDPSQVVFSHDVYPRVTLEHKLVFNFHDKKLIESMQKTIEIPPIVQATLQPSVLIDCGHGGADAGVIGCHALAEKSICLAVGKKVADLLKKKGFLVNLVRENDVDMSLEQRIAMMHDLMPHLFVSIHANGSRSQEAQGIETYYFDRVSSTKNPLLQTVLESYYRKQALCAKALAASLQGAIMRVLASHHPQPRDRKIKSEPLQLLMYASVPAALIEIGFLTNEQEAALLAQDSYQSLLAQGIENGITLFLEARDQKHTLSAYPHRNT